MRRPAQNLTSYDYYRPSSKVASVQQTRSSLRILYSRPARLLIIALIVMLSLHGMWSKHVAAQAAARQAAAQAALAVAHQKSDQFGRQLQQILAGYPGITVSVATATGELGAQSFGETSTFDAASTAKLLTAVTFLHQVEHGKATLQTPIGGQTAQAALNAMLIYSDDDAWTAFNAYLGHPALVAQASALGITDYNAETNHLSATDTARVLEGVVDGSLLSFSHRQLLMSAMARANYRDYIVPAVIRPNLVYHKIGMNDDNVHDAAIIKHGEQWLVLVIYTNGNGRYNWGNRAQLMQEITRAAQTAYL